MSSIGYLVDIREKEIKNFGKALKKGLDNVSSYAGVILHFFGEEETELTDVNPLRINQNPVKKFIKSLIILRDYSEGKFKKRDFSEVNQAYEICRKAYPNLESYLRSRRENQ